MDNSVDYITSFSELSIGDSGPNVTKLPECFITAYFTAFRGGFQRTS